MNPLARSCLALTALAVTAAAQAEHQARIWTDSTGKHQIKAKFIDLLDGVVRLERPNGDISKLPLEKLSEEDQQWVEDISSGRVKQPKPSEQRPKGLQPGDKVEADHFSEWLPATVVSIDYESQRIRVLIEGGPNSPWPMDLDELRMPDDGSPPILVPPPSPESNLRTLRPDLSGVELILAAGGASPTVSLAPRQEPPGSVRAVRTSLGAKGGSGIKDPKDFVITSASPPMAVIVWEVGVTNERAFVQLIDVASGKVVLTGPAPEGTGRLAASPSGRRLATFPGTHGGSDSNGMLHVWDLEGEKPAHALGFVPYNMYSWPKLDPRWVAWVDDQRLFTSNSDGRLILWEVDQARAAYEIEIGSRARPILSHDGAKIFIPSESGVRVHDCQSGEQQANVGSADVRSAELALSPNGRLLAVASNGFLDITDLSTGETTRSFPCEGLGNDSIGWIDDTYVYSSGGLVLHVPLRLVAWEYDMQAAKVRQFGGRHWALLGNMVTGYTVAPLELPPPEAAQAIAGLDPDEIAAVRPGDPISLEVRINQGGFLAKEVEQALREGLGDAGFEPRDGAPLKLVATMSNGGKEKITYRRFGAFRNEGQTIDVQKRAYKLELQLDGVPIWERKTVDGPPHFLQMEQGETIQTALARVLKPTAFKFRGRLPTHVVRPEFRGPLGTSTISAGR